MAKYNIFTVELIKKKDKITYPNNLSRRQYQEFIKSLSEGQKLTMFIEAHNDDGFTKQLAKIHACIREIASEMGDSFKSTKLMIKEESGLYFEIEENTYYEKSFAYCSVAELTLAIQAIIEAGDALNINFRGQFPEYRQS